MSHKKILGFALLCFFNSALLALSPFDRVQAGAVELSYYKDSEEVQELCGDFRRLIENLDYLQYTLNNGIRLWPDHICQTRIDNFAALLGRLCEILTELEENLYTTTPEQYDRADKELDDIAVATEICGPESEPMPILCTCSIDSVCYEKYRYIAEITRDAMQKRAEQESLSAQL